MSRITLPTVETMTAAQRRAVDEIVAGKRGRAPQPFLAWLRSPELASRAQRLGEFVRYETSLTGRLSELAILVVARWWASEYEWTIHRAEALKAGLAENVIDAIARQQPPPFDRADEAAVYEFSTSVCETRTVSDAIYQRAVDAVGEQGVVELVGLLGYYTLISMTLNVFDLHS